MHTKKPWLLTVECFVYLTKLPPPEFRMRFWDLECREGYVKICRVQCANLKTLHLEAFDRYRISRQIRALRELEKYEKVQYSP